MRDEQVNSDSDTLESLDAFFWPDDESVEATAELLKASGVDVDGTVSAVKRQVAAMVEHNRLATLRAARDEIAAAKAKLQPIPKKSRQEMLGELKKQGRMVARKMNLTLDDLSDEQVISAYEDLKQAEQLDDQ